MIVSRTPYRISFFGGGTDYPVYYLRHGGRVLGAAINKYCYISVRRLPPFFTHKHRIVYSKTELVGGIGEIQHPSVRETMRHLNIDYGITVHHDGDIPANSGMGTSSAFTVGLLNSLLALEGRMASKRDLAETAIRIEQELIGENVGSQDQTFSAYGGLNTIEFLANGEIIVSPLIMPPQRLQELERSLLLVFTGFSRNASEIAAEQMRQVPANLGIMSEMKEFVRRGYDLLAGDAVDYGLLGRLLHDSWSLKKRLSGRITTTAIDAIYDAALAAGARGGKLLGAGGGGCMLFVVDPDARERVADALPGCLPIPFTFDFDGSRIIVYEPNYGGKP